jgi:hypothetical protein
MIIIDLWQVFWLMFSPAYLPIRGPHGQWFEVLPGDFQPPAKAPGGLVNIHSYGDSAGFAPDFPFNDAGRQP